MRICFLTAFHASWTEQEVTILKELGHVVHLLYPSKYVSKRIYSIPIVGNFCAYMKLFLMNMRVLLSSDFIYCWFVFPSGVFAVFYGRLFRKPVVLTAIGSDVALVPTIQYGAPSKSYYRPLISWALKNATTVTAISRDVALWAEKWGGKEVNVVYEGIDVQKFKPLEIGQFEKKDYLLLIVSVLDKLNVKRKDFESLLLSLPHVLSAFPNTKLVIVGRRGDGYSTLKHLVRKSKIEGNVVFKGSVSDSELIELYNNCDIFVLPSLHEGFPTVCAEAQSCGKPVVTTNVASIPEVVKKNETGILVRPRDSKALAEAIKELLSDSVLRKKMGSVGRRRVIQLFSKEIRKKKLQAMLANFQQSIGGKRTVVSCDIKQKLNSFLVSLGEENKFLALTLLDLLQSKLLALRTVKEKVVGVAGIRSKNLFFLVVKKDWQDRGIGQELTGKILIRAVKRNYNYVALSALSSNTKAIHIYQKFGFKVVYSYKVKGKKTLFMILPINWKGTIAEKIYLVKHLLSSAISSKMEQINSHP